MRMSVAERDYFELIKADWPDYEITHDPERDRPFQAVRRDDPDTVLSCHTPQELRALIRHDHCGRSAS